MIQVIKELRLEADTLSGYIKSLPGSPEVTKANNSITMAKCWMGKFLGLLGEETPYQNDGKRKEVKDIETATETHSTLKPLTGTQVEQIDWIRERISLLLKDYNTLITDECNPESIKPMVILCSIEQHLHEARFWLGLALGSIRDSASKL